MSNSTPDYRALSVSERIQLVEDIWDSIVAENPESVQLTPAQRAELKRRLDAHDADPSSAVSWDEVRSELFQRNH
jgi:putative addiction module component (TIGR02574 family)